MSTVRRRIALSLTPAVFAALSLGAVATAVLVAVLGGRVEERERRETVGQERRQQAEVVARRVAAALSSSEENRLVLLLEDTAATLGVGLSVIDRQGVVQITTGSTAPGTVVPLWTDGGRTVERALAAGEHEVMVPLSGAGGFAGELRLRYEHSLTTGSTLAIVPALAALCGGLFLAALAALLANAWNQRVRSVAVAVRGGEDVVRCALDPALEELRRSLIAERDETDAALEAARQGTLRLAREIVHSLELQGHVSAGHGERVRRLAVQFVRAEEVPEDVVQVLDAAAPLLDLGKATVRPSALRKCSGLDATERDSLRQHPVQGAALLAGIPSLAGVAETIRAQSERYDGGGYPDGLRGGRIPLAARIVAICSAHAMLVHGSRFGPPLRWPDALDRLREDRGEAFDPELFDRFEDFIREISPRESGSAEVILSSGGILPHRITDEPDDVEQLVEDVEIWLASCDLELEIVPDENDHESD